MKGRFTQWEKSRKITPLDKVNLEYAIRVALDLAEGKYRKTESSYKDKNTTKKKP